MAPAMRLLSQRLNREFSIELEPDWHIRCVCHIMNRAAVDAERKIKQEIESVRSLLKIVRVSATMRHAFSQIQVRLGRTQKLEVPSLDVENRWNSMFTMINSCYKLRDVFEALWNSEEFKTTLCDHVIPPQNWRVLKSSIDYLERMQSYTKAASGQAYATLSIQCVLFD
jgi:hypothetical protein